MTVEVRIIPPSRSLSPNGSHGHWSKVAKARSESRLEAKLSAISSMQAARARGVEFPLGPVVQVSAQWFQGAKPGCGFYKPLDGPNAWAALKAAIDGCVDAGLIAGDSHKILKQGYMELLRTKKEHRGISKVLLTFEVIE